MEPQERAGTLPDDALETKKPAEPGEGGPAIKGDDLEADASRTPGTPPDGQVAQPSGQDGEGAAPANETTDDSAPVRG
jgi:hypothetical protein